MNKKIIYVAATLLLGASAGFTSCEYNDNDLWEAVDDLTQRVTTLEEQVANTNTDLSALRQIVESLQNAVTITSVEQGADGYTIKFSDGQTATVTNGRNGSNAPEISVVKGDDGRYYWTLGGQEITVDGEKLPTSGLAPQVRINDTTKEWEISTDGGQTWTSTGVKAEPEEAPVVNQIFRSVDTSDDAYVLFTLADGSTFRVARYDANTPLFAIEGVEGVQSFIWGKTKTYTVRAENVANYTISRPDGWRVAYTDGTITVTAPAKSNPYAEAEGDVAFNLVSAAGRSLIVKIAVSAADYELRTLTFEDADSKFAPFKFDYCNKTISTWSDLIDTSEYGGPMLYNDYSEAPYYWVDGNNTMLRGQVFNDGPYWMGGEAVSNYGTAEFKGMSFNNQLTVYQASYSNSNAGHNGSANFCMHYGWSLPYEEEYLALAFSDGKARVIDHLYAAHSAYGMNSLTYGDGFNSAATATTWIRVVAVGQTAAGTQTEPQYFYLCQNGVPVTEWSKFDLSGLGEVTGVWFKIEGSSDQSGQYGLNYPGYFAYDDVAVRFTE